MNRIDESGKTVRLARALCCCVVMADMVAPASAEERSPATALAQQEAPLDLSVVDRLLTTTRTVRKRLDLTRPVEPEVIQEAIEIALQAPTGRNQQNWRFLVVTDPDKKKAVAAAYRKAFETYAGARPAGEPSTPGERIAASAWHLSDHMHEVPVLVIACIEGRVEDRGPAAQASHYGSILPSAWSLMLALRARGLGSAWTTLHLTHEKEVARVLGIPDSVTQAVLLPVAYYEGEDFRPAPRRPGREVTYWNSWGERR
jgi:nitroreductase